MGLAFIIRQFWTYVNNKPQNVSIVKRRKLCYDGYCLCAIHDVGGKRRAVIRSGKAIHFVKERNMELIELYDCIDLQAEIVKS